MEFRAYQQNIADSSYNKYTLVILPTALGKTVIAILVSAHSLYNYRHRRVLVMAPTRPLGTTAYEIFLFSIKNITRSTD
ncbi:MAG: DEAD/DEAH box helicase [Nitrososphaeraceae archaeon]